MDDPWGSPWADEIHIQNQNSNGPKESAIRPTTPVKATTLALGDKTTSPWNDADNDDFGDWAALPTEDASGSGLGFDGVEEDRKRNTQESATEEHTALSIWDNDAVAPAGDIGKLAPSVLSRSAGLVRQPSPDPWATATSPGARQLGNEDHGNHTHKEEESKAEAVEDVIPLETSIRVPEPIEDEVPIQETTLDEKQGEKGNSTEGPTTPAEGDVETQDRESSHPVLEASTNPPQADGISSRPSSSPSEHSHPDDVPQDSPRTSLDDEPKGLENSRSPSKVQELVEHFDGLAKKKSEESSPIVAQSTEDTQTDGDDVDDFDDDFGDFEEGNSEAEGSVVAEDSAETNSTNIAKESTSTAIATSRDLPMPSRVPAKDLGPVEFNIDVSSLDQLFTDIEMQTPSEKVYIPDTVSHDSFSSVEQRKTWYRISRYGSMRKHNKGDDDNYAQVKWAQTHVRQETLKVVARWMEEDRVSGRVILGGGSKGSTVFGWNDAKVAPVPLAHAFAPKQEKKAITAAVPSEPEVPREWPKGLVRKASSSRTRSSSKGRRRSSTKSPVAPEDPRPVAPMIPANFGWSSSPVSSKAVVQSIPEMPPPKSKAVAKVSQSDKLVSSLHRSSSTSAQSRPKAVVHKRASSTNVPSLADNIPPPRPLSIVQKPTPIPPSIPISKVLDEDDDWGEMVSSPITATAPSFPLPNLWRQPPSSSLVASTPANLDSFGMTSMPTPPNQSPWNPQLATFKNFSPKPASIPKLESPMDTFSPRTNSKPATQSPWSDQPPTFDNKPSLPASTPTNIISSKSFSMKAPDTPPTQSPWDALGSNGFGSNAVAQNPTPAFVDSMDIFQNHTVQANTVPFSPSSTTNFPANTIAPASTPAVDPWASADFSFFDTPPPPPAKSTPKIPISKPPPPKSVAFNSPALPPPRKDQRTREEIEQDKIVQKVVKGLPDLSYMLRR